MTIRHLRIFKLVCEMGSFTLAAKKLYMTQPAVSHAISELEEELGTKLFDRISKRIWLNQKLLLRERGSAIRDVFDSLLRLHGLSASPRYTSVNSQALLQARGRGWESPFYRSF